MPPPPSGFLNVNLKDLLFEFEERKGVAKYVVMGKIRDYVTRQDLLTVVDEIRTITDEKHLDVLIGVGMRRPLWDTVIARRAFLEGLT